jgi:hypothetical protein
VTEFVNVTLTCLAETQRLEMIRGYIDLILSFLKTILHKDYNPSIDIICSAYQIYGEFCAYFSVDIEKKIDFTLLRFMKNILLENGSNSFEFINAITEKIRIIKPTFN